MMAPALTTSMTSNVSVNHLILAKLVRSRWTHAKPANAQMEPRALPLPTSKTTSAHVR